MSRHPVDGVYSFVERAYVRMQAGDLLIRCLEDVSIKPIQQLVESLVLGGSSNIYILREILREAGRRKLQVEEDLCHLYNGCENTLKSYGVRLPDKLENLVKTKFPQSVLLDILRQQGIRDQVSQEACLQILKETRDIMESLSVRLELLAEIERYLEDWVWGVACLSNQHKSNLH